MGHIALARGTRILLYGIALFVALMTLGVFVVPELRAFFAEAYYGDRQAQAWGVTIFLAAMGCLALWILVELAGVLRTVETDPFVEGNVRALFRMGLGAQLAGVAFFIKCFFLFTFMTAVCALVMVLSGLFALVLSQVFRRAVEYKQENDLTI